jgi:chemotaxis signal transduction protein
MQPSDADLQVDTYLPYMRDVVRCEESLRELNLTWRMIEASAKINCPQEARSILPMMTATRVGFENLEKDLVASLVGERVAHVLDEVGTKASHIVNIIVRNLYERTADVGFLATDRELCDFVAGVQPDRDRVTRRLRAYRDKYTVYNDILLLDPDGNVLAQIDEESPVEGSRDPLLAQTLAAEQYVETFRATDLRPGERCALIYSRRMQGADGRVVGVLCLSFDFTAEMAGIFRSRRDGEDRAVMLLLDGDQQVIASADEQWVPVGTTVPVHHGEGARLVMHSGREYLVRTYRAEAYQGYPGPAGWQGSVMIPIDVAFTGRRSRALQSLDPAIAAGLLTHARSFCPPLYQIVTAAQSIRRVVWNGQVMTASQRRDLHKLKSILEQVSDTGARTNALFSESIRDLYDTVLGSTQRRSEFTARLLVDLLDRNLYERSDDCRWWALTPLLRQALADGTAAHDPASLDGLLEDIHHLYTVYTRLVVYDLEGRIVAGTALKRDDGSSLRGETIEADDLQAVLALRDAQAYHVSPFRAGVLSQGQPTYVYHAAIRDPADDTRVVGGIGIAFDATREFPAMLAGGLVNHQEGGALFVNRSGRVIGSTDANRPVGYTVALPADMLQVPAGQSCSRILVHRGQYMVVACSANSGYREFKVSDGYRDDVLAVVFGPLGAEQTGRTTAEDAAALQIEPDDDLQAGEEYATFFLNGQLHALPAAHVLQASPGSEIVPVSLERTAGRLGTLPLRHNGQTDRYVWVHDLMGMATGSLTARPADHQVIVVRHRGRELGLLVDSLHGVPEFSARDIVELPPDAATRGAAVRRLIKANRGTLLIPVLDLDALWPAPALADDEAVDETAAPA